MAKRDGWRVVADTKRQFSLCNGDIGAYAMACWDGGPIFVHTIGALMPPARAIQFAQKVQDIAARAANKAAKEAKRGR